MKKLKLKSWVVPALYVVSISIIFISVVMVGKLMATDYEKAVLNDNVHVPSGIVENNSTVPVVEVTNQSIIKPFTADGVNVTKGFYSLEDSEENQLKSLIFYKNTYMENTGVLYTSENAFDVVAVLDGNVTSITKDEILGNVVEVTHSTNLITIYHCLSEVSVKVGDAIKQGDVIGKSGSVNIDDTYKNALLFEVNYQGQIINPNDFYNMQVEELLR